MSEPILVDTSAWVAFLRKPQDPIGRQVQALLEQDRALLCNLVLGELLAGSRSEQEFERLRVLLADAPRAGESEQDWIEGAHLASKMRRAGASVPLADCVVAAIGLRLDCALLTLDGDFERIPGVRRLEPVRE